MAAAAALVAGGLTAPPAQALEIDSTVECAPGQGIVEAAPPESGIANCDNASPWIAAPVIDAILGAVASDLGISVADLNKAIVVLAGGTPTIVGNGFNLALAALGGNPTANAQTPLSGAIALAIAGEANATASLGGVAAAINVGNSTATSNALPLGVTAVMASSGDASATALGGFAGAFPTLVGALQGPDQAICTALYGTASIDGASGTTSCTSVLFIFQRSQTAGGPVVYAVKNPLSLGLASPLQNLAPLAAIPGMEILGDLAGLEFLPVFQDDLIRIVMNDDGPTVETDLFGSSTPEADTETEAESTVTALTTGRSDEESPDDQPVQEVQQTDVGGASTGTGGGSTGGGDSSDGSAAGTGGGDGGDDDGSGAGTDVGGDLPETGGAAGDDGTSGSGDGGAAGDASGDGGSNDGASDGGDSASDGDAEASGTE